MKTHEAAAIAISLNPHQDEGSDNGADVAVAPRAVQSLGEADVRVSIGPLRTNVAFAEWGPLWRYNIAALTPTAGAPSRKGPTLIYHLAPSDRQLVAAAYNRIVSTYGKNLCILDDGSPEGRLRASLMTAHATNPLHLTIPPGGARNPLVVSCMTGMQAVFLGSRNLMIFTGPRVANRLSIANLLDRTFSRDFSLTAIGSRYGSVYQVAAAPVPRTAQVEAVANAYHAYAKTVASDDALRTYAAVQIATVAAVRSVDALHVLASTNFDTIIGRVAFDAYGDRVGAPIEIKQL